MQPCRSHTYRVTSDDFYISMRVTYGYLTACYIKLDSMDYAHCTNQVHCYIKHVIMLTVCITCLFDLMPYSRIFRLSDGGQHVVGGSCSRGKLATISKLPPNPPT